MGASGAKTVSAHRPPLDLVASEARVAVDVAALSRRFGRVEALTDVTLAIPEGVTFGLLGPNGSGKTTLLRIIAGILRPTSGAVSRFGNPSAAFDTVGYVPQQIGLYDRLTVWENMRCFAGIQGVRSRAQMDETLALLDLAEHRHRPVRELSGGTARRVSLACALVHRPRLLLLDEPTVGVDPSLRARFWNHFLELNDQGVTIVISTHAMDEAERCHRLAILRDGCVLAEGTPVEVTRSAGAATLEQAFIRMAGDARGLA